MVTVKKMIEISKARIASSIIWSQIRLFFYNKIKNVAK